MDRLTDMEDVIGRYKGIKKIAARFYIRLHAPMIRMFSREWERMCGRAANMERDLADLHSCKNKYDALFRDIRTDFELLAENVRNINRQLEGYQNLVENIRNTNMQLESYQDLVENVRNTNMQLESYQTLVENVRNSSALLERQQSLTEDIRTDLESMAINIRNNNRKLENLDSTVDMHGVKIARLQKNAAKYTEPLSAVQAGSLGIHNGNKKKMEGSYDGIDYFDFENHFRGPREQVKQNQEIYLEYFTGRSHVIDLGCGRGEFLELLKENGIGACGVDLYQEFVDLCLEKQLAAVQGDAIEVLEQEKEADGIFAGQLVEHLSLQQIIRLVETAYKKMTKGSYLVLETPNPMSLSIYTNSFYMDPSHNRPVHPLTMKYLLEKAGFREVTIIFTKSSRPPFQIPKLQIEGAAGIEKFNQAMEKAEEMLFGSQDYAIAAKK